MRLFALFTLTALIGLAGCDDTSSTIPVFGDPYNVERRPEPVLEGDSLRVTVSYNGCGSTFEVLSSLSGTELWLKNSSGTCETYRTSELYLPVDTSRLAAPPLRLYINRAETVELKIDSTHISAPDVSPVHGSTEH